MTDAANNSSSLELINKLADRARRDEVAAKLAQHWGAKALFMFVPDPELGVLQPAPGFPQTLPGGPTWRHFMARCRQPGQHCSEVVFPDQDRMVAASAFASEDGSVLVLVGGSPTLSLDEFRTLPFPLLTALLRSEATEQAASGAMAAAREASQRTAALAAALDAARAETQGNAANLQHALAEAARLNQELRSLNETLEQRVSERTRQLEKQIEERLKAEAALLQAQKMEAVGQLTGGVAHDFNNLLSVIIGSLDLIEGIAGENERLLRTIQMAQRAADRGARLTEQLLAFARRQVLRPQMIELNATIQEYEGLLKRAVGETVEVRTEFSPVACYCHIDPVHLETAILNLAINARDAMPLGGTLTIETELCEAEQNATKFSPEKLVRITLKDTGTGMTPEVADRVFEPFFTTKPQGKGTGLGLSQVYGFVEQSGGRVVIDTAVGQGTAVQIFLPATTGSSMMAEVHSKEISKTSASETILVVEDDPDVAEIVVSMLQTAGYHILTARNGAEALKKISGPEQIDLVFTDLVMPGGMSGMELARAARKSRPGLKVLLTSGYAANTGAADEVARDGLAIIVKPYRYNDLITILRSVLDQPQCKLYQI